MHDYFTNDIEGAETWERDNFDPYDDRPTLADCMDDDDRSYNASVEMEPSGLAPGWYPDWKGPDTGAFEDWMDFLRANGESHTYDEEIPLPDDENGYPF